MARPPDPSPADLGEGPIISVPEVRDYREINARIVRQLERGARTVRLIGVSGQRLLASGIQGPWEGTIEVVGDSGPELAAGLNAPGLTIVALGASGHGTGVHLEAGRVVLFGDCGEAVGYAMTGGSIAASAHSGHRLGLRQAGGLIVAAGPTGRLAGDRQSGGVLYLLDPEPNPSLGRGRTGGRLVRDALGPEGGGSITREDAERIRAAFEVESHPLPGPLRARLDRDQSPRFEGR